MKVLRLVFFLRSLLFIVTIHILVLLRFLLLLILHLCRNKYHHVSLKLDIAAPREEFERGLVSQISHHPVSTFSEGRSKQVVLLFVELVGFI